MKLITLFIISILSLSIFAQKGDMINAVAEGEMRLVINTTQPNYGLTSSYGRNTDQFDVKNMIRINNGTDPNDINHPFRKYNKKGYNVNESIGKSFLNAREFYSSTINSGLWDHFYTVALHDLGTTAAQKILLDKVNSYMNWLDSERSKDQKTKKGFNLQPNEESQINKIVVLYNEHMSKCDDQKNPTINATIECTQFGMRVLSPEVNPMQANSSIVNTTIKKDPQIYFEIDSLPHKELYRTTND